MLKIHVVTRDGEICELDASPGTKLMEVLRDENMGVDAICGGECSCGTCHVYISQDWLSICGPTEEDERDMLKVLEAYRENSRLSCQIILDEKHDNLRLTVAPDE